MAKSLAQLKHPFAKLVGDFPTEDVFVIAAHVREGLSKLTEARITFAIKASDMGLDQLLGKRFHVAIKIGDVDGGPERKFLGTCVEAEYMGLAQGYEMYAIETRPWLWFLTQARDNRIFQDKTVPEILKAVFSDHGFSDLQDRLSGSYRPRPYVVQYDESDFDFVQRLMEEEGISFFFDHSGTVEALVLADDRGAYRPIEGEAELPFRPLVMKSKREQNTVFEFRDRQRVRPGKVSLVDRNFENARTKLDVTQMQKRGRHGHNGYEQYRMWGRYGTAAAGEGYARIAAEALAHDAERFAAAANARTLAAGCTMKLKEHPQSAANAEYLVTEAEHFLQVEVRREEEDGGSYAEDSLERLVISSDVVDPKIDDLYVAQLELARSSAPYRPPRTVTSPRMEGVHRAMVTGPGGSEIYTDEYGRIKVQFFWDRDGKEDENSSCWVRVMQPWAQKSFGTVYIPRVGAEVLIMFERNDPDYPICIGQVYNSFDTVPYALPDNMTQTVLFKTRSTEGGGEDNFHEMVLEDKIGEEFIRIQSERDWKQVVENDAEITVGVEKQDPGDMKLTVYNDLTETVQQGNHAFTVGQGDQTVQIQTGKQTVTVKGDHTMKVESGNHSVTVQSGNQTTDISAGKQTVTAAQSIELKVGGSSIKIEPAAITLKAAQIKIEGQAMVQVKAPMVSVNGSGMTEVKGGLVKIN